MNNGKKSAILIVLTTLLTSLAACNDNQHQANNKVSTIRPWQCLEQQSRCSFDMAGGHVEVLFDRNKIIAEQAVNMMVKYQGAATLTNVSGYLEGVDMFMGKIPLFLEQSSVNENPHRFKTPTLAEKALKTPNEIQVFNAELLVGSCSAEKMTWRMWLTLTTSEQQTYNQVLTMVSYRL